MESGDLALGDATATLKSWLDAKPGARGEAMFASRGTVPLVVLYCNPDLAEMLRDRYAGVGHRSHLDRRYWISVDLDADVPFDEIRDLADASYSLVCAGLTRKQRGELEALSQPPASR